MISDYTYTEEEKVPCHKLRETEEMIHEYNNVKSHFEIQKRFAICVLQDKNGTFEMMTYNSLTSYIVRDKIDQQ